MKKEVISNINNNIDVYRELIKLPHDNCKVITIIINNIMKDIKTLLPVKDENLPFLLPLITIMDNELIFKFIKDNEVENIAADNINKIVNKIKLNIALNKQENLFLEKYFSNNINEGYQNLIFDLLIESFYYDYQITEYETQKSICISTMSNLIKKINEHSKIFIEKIDENCSGMINALNIYISEDDFSNFYYGHKDAYASRLYKINFINTFFHELIHLNQMTNGSGALEIDEVIKMEFELKKIDKNFYLSNYRKLMYEKEACEKAEKYSKMYFNKLGLCRLSRKKINLDIDNKLIKSEDYQRIIFGKKQDMRDYLAEYRRHHLSYEKTR